MGWLGAWNYRIRGMYGSVKPASNQSNFSLFLDIDTNPRLGAEYRANGNSRPSMAVTLADGTTTTAFGVEQFFENAGGIAQSAGTAQTSGNTITPSGSVPQNGYAVIWTSSAPSGLSINTTYYVVNATGTTFQVSATLGGSPLTITADSSFGNGTWYLAAASAMLWVKCNPSSSALTGDDYVIVYVDHTQTDQENKAGVADTSTKIFLDLEETPDNSAGQLKDYTSNVNNGTTFNTPTSVTGKLDKGISFNGTNQYIKLGQLTGVTYGGDLTISVWFKVTASATNRGLVGQGGSDAVPTGGSSPTGNVPVMYVDDGGTLRATPWWLGNVSAQVSTGATHVNDGNWHRASLTWNSSGTTVKLYLDGVQKDSLFTAPASSYSSNYYWWVGTAFTNGWGGGGTAWDFFSGILDDLKFAQATRSSDWIAYEYANQNNPSDTITYATDETSSVSFITPTTISVSETLNVPSLIKGSISITPTVIVEQESLVHLYATRAKLIYYTIASGNWNDLSIWGPMFAVIDNGGTGYSSVGGWSNYAEGYNTNEQYIIAGTGSNTATWTFSGLIAGHNYRLALTWVSGGNRATDVPWQVLDSDGTTVLSSGTINQQNNPSSFTYNSALWETLAASATPSGTGLSIKITDGATSNYIIADAAYLNEVITLVAPPASGDVVVINHDVTVSDNRTCGDFPNDNTTPVISIGSGKVLTIANGAILTVQGNIDVKSGTGADNTAVSVQGGGTLIIDSGGATSRPQNYRIMLSTFDNSGNGSKIVTTGTRSNPAVIKASDYGDWAQIASTNIFTRGVDLQWCNFKHLGDASNPSIGFGNTGGAFSVVGCLFDTCGLFGWDAYDLGWTVTDNLWINTPGSTTFQILGSANFISSGQVRTYARNSTDKASLVKAIGTDFSDSLAYGGLGDNSAAGKANSLSEMFFRGGAGGAGWRMGNWSECVDFNDASDLVLTGANAGTYSGLNQSVNPHWASPSFGTPGVWEVFDSIFESLWSTGDGDIDYGPNTTGFDSHFKNVIVLPEDTSDDDSTAPTDAGTLSTNNGWSGENSIYEHCTFYNGDQGCLAIAEAGSGFYHQAQLLSTIVWNDARIAATRGYNYKSYCPVRSGYAAYIAAHPTDPVINDSIQADYNCGWNLLGAGYGGNGYDLPLTESQGSNDVDVNPQFVDSSRRFWTWVKSIEGSTLPTTSTPTRFDYTAWGLYKLYYSYRTENAAYDSRYTLSAYKTYIRNGFAPQNAALQGTAHDAGDIGAVAVVSGQTITESVITESVTLLLPSISAGAVSISPAVVVESQTSVVPSFSEGAVSIPAIVIVESETLVVPGIGNATTIAASVITESVVLNTPALSPVTSISATVIVESETLQTVSLVEGAYSITPPIITEAVLLNPVSVTGPGQIPVAPIVESISLQSPSLTNSGVTLSISTIAETQALNALTLSVGSSSIQPSIIAETENMVVPTVTLGSNMISPSVILETVSIATPTVSLVTSINLTTISQQETAIAPTLTGTVVSITPNLISQIVVVNTPQLVNLSILIDVTGPMDVSFWGVFTVRPNYAS